jgi:hypothetical protein
MPPFQFKKPGLFLVFLHPLFVSPFSKSEKHDSQYHKYVYLFVYCNNTQKAVSELLTHITKERNLRKAKGGVA